MKVLGYLSIFILCCLHEVSCQKKFRLFNANFKECDGADKGLLKINGIGISAPLGRKDKCLNKHLLVKGRRVQICVNGTLPETLPFPTPIQGTAGLKNSAHGSLPALPPQEFCDIVKDSCEGATPACNQIVAGQTIELCSALVVPNDPLLLNDFIQPDVLVRWRILHEAQSNPSVCETKYERKRGQTPLVCIDIDTKVVNEARCPRDIIG